MTLEGSNEVGHGCDGAGELAEVTTDDEHVMAITRSCRSHGVALEHAGDLGPVLGGDVVTDQFEPIEHSAVVVENRVKVLVPPKRMRGNDRRAVTLDDRKQLGQGNANRRLPEVGKSVNEEMPLARRNLRTGENQHVPLPPFLRELSQLLIRPLNVVLGDDHSVETDLMSPLDQFARFDDAVR